MNSRWTSCRRTRPSATHRQAVRPMCGFVLRRIRNCTLAVVISQIITGCYQIPDVTFTGIDGSGSDNGDSWRCNGKTNLIDSAQFFWQTNPTPTGSYTSNSYTSPMNAGPSNPNGNYADQIATGNLTDLSAGVWLACVEYEISSVGSAIIEPHIASAPPDTYGFDIGSGAVTRSAGHHAECFSGSASRDYSGWQFAFEVWTPRVMYQLDRAAVCQQ